MIDPITRCSLSPKFHLHLIHTDGHFKFWEASCNGEGKVMIRYGRIGDYGQELIKDRSYFEKKAPQKLKKGYVVKELILP